MTSPQKFTQNLVKGKLPHHWRIRSRLILSILVALIISVLLPPGLSLSTRILCIWDAGILCFLASTWVLMVKASPKTMRRNAQS